MSGRLPSHLLVGALMRQAEGEGGFATLIRRGDKDSGSIALILIERGANPRLFERSLLADESYGWRESASGDEVANRVERQRRFDPDLWVIELDVADSERFAAEMTSAC